MYEECLELVKKNGLSIIKINKKYKVYELCLEAVKQNGHAIMHVPNNIKNEELCVIAVKQNGIALKCIPLSYKTREICLIATLQNESAFYHVLTEYKTYFFVNYIVDSRKCNYKLEYYARYCMCRRCLRTHCTDNIFYTYYQCMLSIKEDMSNISIYNKKLFKVFSACLFNSQLDAFLSGKIARGKSLIKLLPDDVLYLIFEELIKKV